MQKILYLSVIGSLVYAHACMQLGMAMNTAHNGFAITKPKSAQNLNYQTHPQPTIDFNFFKKTHLLWILTITKLAMVSDRFYGFVHLK